MESAEDWDPPDDVDYEEGTFLYDVKQEGWLLGLTWAF